MKKKIIFVDIDDTLNPSNGSASEYTINVMDRLKEKGYIIVVNTGRSTKYAVEKSIEAHLSNYVISSNGAEVYDYEKRKVIFEQSIPKKIIKSVYDYCVETGLTLILNSLEKRFINITDYKYNNEPAIYFDNIDKVLKDNKINQLVILSKNYDRMLVIPNMFKEKFPTLKVVHSSIGLIEGKRVRNKEYYHDLVMEHTAKSTGLVELLDYLGLTIDDAIVIGNGYDDQCMFDVVDTSIAVKNANDVLRNSATYIAEEAKDDGVAKILEKLLLSKN